jgi:hypothetical protein
VFSNLQAEASAILPQRYPALGNLVAIDGSFIDAVLSMKWADYRTGANKAKVHMGFDINRSIPRKLFLTEGKTGDALLFPRFSLRVKRELWIGDISVMNVLMPGRQIIYCLPAGLKQVQIKLLSELIKLIPIAVSFLMLLFYWVPQG